MPDDVPEPCPMRGDRAEVAVLAALAAGAIVSYACSAEVAAATSEARHDSPLFAANNSTANSSQDRMTLVVGRGPFAVLKSSRCGNCPREHWSAVPGTEDAHIRGQAAADSADSPGVEPK